MIQYLVYPAHDREYNRTYIEAMPVHEASPIIQAFSKHIPHRVKRIYAKNEKEARLLYNLVP